MQHVHAYSNVFERVIDMFSVSILKLRVSSFSFALLVDKNALIPANYSTTKQYEYVLISPKDLIIQQSTCENFHGCPIHDIYSEKKKIMKNKKKIEPLD